MVGTLNQSESCAEVCGGMWKGAQRYAEVRGTEVCRGGGKNQDFMLIQFLNARM